MNAPHTRLAARPAGYRRVLRWNRGSSRYLRNHGLPVSAVLEIDEEGKREAEKRVVKQPSAVGALWTIPALYGVLLLAVSAWWLVVGEPFDHGTYERIGEAPWDVMMGPFASSQSAVFAAVVRLLGGNGGLLAGGLTVALARFGYRSGARWAWFMLWLLPVHALLDLMLLTASGGFSVMAVVWDGGLATVMIATQVVSYSRFS